MTFPRISYKCRRENQNTYFVLITFFLENRAVVQLNLENTVKNGRQEMTIWRMCIARRIPKATNAHGLCNTHCFSTAKMVARTCLDIT